MMNSEDGRRQSEVRGVDCAKVGHRQLQLELAIGVGEVAAVQVAYWYVIAVPLGGRFERELHLITEIDRHELRSGYVSKLCGCGFKC